LEDIYIRHQQQKTGHKYARGTGSEGFGIAVFNISTKMTNEGSVVVICVLKNIHWLCLLKEDKSMGNHAGTCSLREYLVSVQLYFETFTWTREREWEREWANDGKNDDNQPKGHDTVTNKWS
jgi:hypothetical protein